MSKTIQKIKKLNLAHKYFTKALELIRANAKIEGDNDTHFWRIQKSYTALQQGLMKQLQNDDIDDQFKDITKKYKK